LNANFAKKKNYAHWSRIELARSDRGGLQNTIQLSESHRQLNTRYCYPQLLC